MLAYDNFWLEKITKCPERGARPPLRGAILIVGLSSAIDTYPSGHATDEIRVSTSGGAQSLRDRACPDRERVYINLDSRKTRGETMKKSESERESEEKQWKSLTESIVNQHDDRIRRLEERIMALEKILVHVQHTNTDDGTRHQNDGGWFD